MLPKMVVNALLSLADLESCNASTRFLQLVCTDACCPLAVSFPARVVVAVAEALLQRVKPRPRRDRAQTQPLKGRPEVIVTNHGGMRSGY